MVGVKNREGAPEKVILGSVSIQTVADAAGKGNWNRCGGKNRYTEEKVGYRHRGRTGIIIIGGFQLVLAKVVQMRLLPREFGLETIK